jgi:hypothetical protein
MEHTMPTESVSELKGSLIASDEDEKFNGWFFPEGLKFSAIRRSVPVSRKQGFLACTKCGCLWSYVEATKLRELLTKSRKGESVFAPGLSHRARWGLQLTLLLVLCGAAVGLKSLFGA